MGMNMVGGRGTKGKRTAALYKNRFLLQGDNRAISRFLTAYIYHRKNFYQFVFYIQYIFRFHIFVM